MGGRIRPGHAVCLHGSLSHLYNIPLPFFSFFFPRFSPNSWPWGTWARRQPTLLHCEGQEIPLLPGGSHPHGWHPDELIKKKQGRRGASPWGQLLGDAVSGRDARGSQGAASRGAGRCWGQSLGSLSCRMRCLGCLACAHQISPKFWHAQPSVHLLHLAPAKVVMIQNGNGEEKEDGHLHCQQKLISWRRLVSPGSVFFFLAPLAQVGRSGDRHRQLEVCWVLTFRQLLPDNAAPLPPPGIWQGHLGDSGDFGDISYSLCTRP